jgi:ferredoxin
MLRLSADRKVTNMVTPSGKSVKVKNTFGLPSGSRFSCPGMTSVCESVCYAGQIEKQYVAVRNLLLGNWNALQGKSTVEMADMLTEMVASFDRECDRVGAVKKFRLHWDGDFFSHSYTQAWALTMLRFPDIQFWVYTRSFSFVPALRGVENVTVYLSTDSENALAAVECRKENPFVHYAVLGKTFVEGRLALPIIPKQKVYNCPENDRRIPLISEKGSACIRCGVCVVGRGDVVFSASKK